MKQALLALLLMTACGGRVGGATSAAYTSVCTLDATDNLLHAVFDHQLAPSAVICNAPHADYTRLAALYGTPTLANGWQPLTVDGAQVFCGDVRAPGAGDHQLCDSITIEE